MIANETQHGVSLREGLVFIRIFHTRKGLKQHPYRNFACHSIMEFFPENYPGNIPNVSISHPPQPVDRL